MALAGTDAGRGTAAGRVSGLVEMGSPTDVLAGGPLPTISLTGASGSVSASLSKLFTGPANVWSFAGSFTGPIFTAGAISGQVAQAEAGQKAALYNYQQSIQSAFADVSDALIARQKLGEQSKAQEELVLALHNYSRLARMQYDGGYAPYFAVLQAEQQLFPAELSWAATRASTFASLVRIYQALGGGWIDEAAKLTEAQIAPAASR